MEDLKSDGTFVCVGGASDLAVCKLNFTENDYVFERIMYSEAVYDNNNQLKMQWYIENNPCRKEEFEKLMISQSKKPELEWHDMDN